MSCSTYSQMLARLTTNVALMEAQVKADPLPFLRRATREMAELRKVLMDVETALCDTNWVYDDAAKVGVPADCYRADTERVQKARAVLSKWMRGHD